MIGFQQIDRCELNLSHHLNHLPVILLSFTIIKSIKMHLSVETESSSSQFAVVFAMDDPTSSPFN
jgi:hypothetical protein